MARVTAVSLRNRAREAMLLAGGRGFVRFPERGALLVSDAVRRCGDDAQKHALLCALAQAGFVCREQDGLLLMDPSDALLEEIACETGAAVDWSSPRCAAQALAARWLRRQALPLTEAGRQLIIDTLRQTWQHRAEDDFSALRAQAAVMQRAGDVSGLYQAGAVLAHWCEEQEGKGHED